MQLSEPGERTLPSHALEQIRAFLGADRGLGPVRRLPLKQLVSDYCDKFIALDAAGAPAAFIVVSPSTHPDSVRDAATSTHEARAALGPALGDSVLLPAFVGDIDGNSYSISAYCEPMSSSRWRGRWQRLRTTPAILRWLSQVTEQTSRAVPRDDSRIERALRALSVHAAVAESTRSAAVAALGELQSGRWTPRYVLAHNDLWWGNFVRRTDAPADAFPFFVIDWAGSKVDGAAIYDLVRIAMSLRLGAGRFRKALREHCLVLGCSPEQSLHYLCVAFGELAQDLGEWPVEQFGFTANACLRYVSEALA